MQTVYTITDAASPGPLLITAAFGLLGTFAALVALVRVLISSFRRQSKQVLRHALVFLGAVLVGAFGWSLFLPQYAELRVAREAYRTGHCRLAEGVVQVVRRQKPEGHSPGDLIRIGDTELTVDAFSGAPGYSVICAQNGILQDGVHVRVHHWQGKILRIDVAERG